MGGTWLSRLIRGVAPLVLFAAVISSGGLAGAAATAPVVPGGGPPAWAVPGVRITMYTSFAALAAGVYELVEDPNGALVDPTTGKRYRESYSGTATGPSSGGSGEGYFDVTIVGVEGTDVVLQHTEFYKSPFDNTISTSFGFAERVGGATLGGQYISPDVLATLRSGEGEAAGRLVLRGPVTVNGSSVEAVLIVNPTPGAYSMVGYDAASGLLVTSAVRSQSTTGGELLLGLQELRGSRNLAMPGLGAAVPAWLAARPTLNYVGTTEFANPLDPAQPAMSTALTRQVTVSDLGANWALFATKDTASGMDVPRTEASGGAGPYWWDSAALAAMTQGQVLDTDPVTGVSVTVTEVTAASVAVTTAASGSTSSATYDLATGTMLEWTSTTSVSGQTERLTLQR